MCKDYDEAHNQDQEMQQYNQSGLLMSPVNTE